MLDAETKRRIDSCRDILVGKVPDPKSQVEQITIALIYKFMDDMDAEAEEFGGERTFFAGEFARYGWTKLMSPTMGGYDVLNLYSEAIQKMPANPGIPALFRDIFKNAYLPYRDPETLRAFVKEINAFRYDHSERLGDAFEYLLSVLGSQGDAGQFRTPRHIIEFIVNVVAPQKHETILDPACGTAGFLISSYKHILKANTKDRPGDLLTPDERARLAAHLRGYDISPDMVRLSLVNLYLHGFSAPHIEEYDTLTSDEKWNEHADVILANPPFMSPKGGIRPHKRFGVQSNRSEVLFVDYIAEHLSPNGRAGIIVPEGVIFQSGTAYKQLREMLVKNYLVAVVSLPAGVFQPYSGVKTSVLIMDRKLAKTSDSILFVKIESDGFGLGAQRRATEANDLPAAAQHLKAWMESLRNQTLFLPENSRTLNAVPKCRIAESGDYKLSADRYIDSLQSPNLTYPMVRLSEICERVSDTITPEEHSGMVNYIGLENIESNTGVLVGSAMTEYKSIKSAKTRFAAGHVLYGKLRPNLNKVYLALQPGICSTDILVFQANENIDARFLREMLRSPYFNAEVLKGLGGAQLPRVSSEYLTNLVIPFPPLDAQKEIVAEIEGYQQIIDGARQVVENYKPRILISPDWPIVEFQNAPLQIIDGDRGSNYPSKEEFSPTGYCLFLNTKNVRPNGFSFEELNFISKEKHDALRKGKLTCGDVVLTTRGTIGNTAHFASEVPFEHIRINSGMVILRPDPHKIVSDYLFNFLQSENFGHQMRNIVSGSAQPQLPIRDLNFALIPLPDLETQKAIVAEIEAEQKLVAGNKELIRLFEGKIQAVLARVWEE